MLALIIVPAVMAYIVAGLATARFQYKCGMLRRLLHRHNDYTCINGHDTGCYSKELHPGKATAVIVFWPPIVLLWVVASGVVGLSYMIAEGVKRAITWENKPDDEG